MADSIIEGTHPTRMELLQVRNRLRLATKGHRLLKEKRDTLITEFMRLARQSGSAGEEAAQMMERARHSQSITAALAGQSQLTSAAMGQGLDGLSAQVSFRNVMGIQLPDISLEGRMRQLDERGWGLITTHPSIDAAAEDYEHAVESLVHLAATENSLVALSSEVKRAKRRVNALEYRVIPQLTNTQKYIRMRLEEFEREGFYRRKLIKKKRETP